MDPAPTLTESSKTTVQLTDEEAEYLSDVGQRLAGSKAWWGDDERETERPPTVIRCSRISGHLWNVTVSDAVGVIGFGDRQLLVQPKIPTDHLLYLLGRSEAFPRLHFDQAQAAAGADLWRLIVVWFLDAVETLLRRDLVSDYAQHRDDLEFLRGRVDVVATARRYYAGRLDLPCEYEEISVDTPLNRLLRAAAQVIAAAPELPFEPRRRARRALARLDDAGPLEPSDVSAQTDRRTAHYRDSIMLARNIITKDHRHLAHGKKIAWTFLIRTPEMVEAGVRAVIADALCDTFSVAKRGLQLPGSTLKVNPDLVFGDVIAVGDVKYRLNQGEWNRSELYQTVAFAAAFRAREGLVVNFVPPAKQPPSSVCFGDIRVSGAAWPAHETLATPAAVALFTDSIRAWACQAIARTSSSSASSRPAPAHASHSPENL